MNNPILDQVTILANKVLDDFISVEKEIDILTDQEKLEIGFSAIDLIYKKGLECPEDNIVNFYLLYHSICNMKNRIFLFNKLCGITNKKGNPKVINDPNSWSFKLLKRIHFYIRGDLLKAVDSIKTYMEFFEMTPEARRIYEKG